MQEVIEAKARSRYHAMRARMWQPNIDAIGGRHTLWRIPRESYMLLYIVSKPIYTAARIARPINVFLCLIDVCANAQCARHSRILSQSTTQASTSTLPTL